MPFNFQEPTAGEEGESVAGGGRGSSQGQKGGKVEQKGDQVTHFLKSGLLNGCSTIHIFRDSSHDGGKEGHRTGADSAEAVNIIVANSLEIHDFNNLFFEGHQ